MQVFFPAPCTHIVLDDPAKAQKTIDQTSAVLTRIRQELSECIPQTTYSVILRTKVLVIQSKTVSELSTRLTIMRVNALFGQLHEASAAFIVSMQGCEHQFADQIGAVRLQFLALSKYTTNILNQNNTLLEKQLAAL